MSKIVVVGNKPLTGSVIAYLQIDGAREQTLKYAKQPFSFSVPRGRHSVFLSTLSPLRRSLSGTGVTRALESVTEDTWYGEVTLDEDDVLFVYAESKFKSQFHLKVIPASELQTYLKKYALSGGKPKRSKLKVILLLLALFAVAAVVVSQLGVLADRVKRNSGAGQNAADTASAAARDSAPTEARLAAQTEPAAAQTEPAPMTTEAPALPTKETAPAVETTEAPSSAGVPKEGSHTALSTLFSSAARLLNYNDLVYFLDGNGLYCCEDGVKTCLYAASLNISSGFCTDGNIAFVQSSAGKIVKVLLAEHTGQELFSTESYAKGEEFEIMDDPTTYIVGFDDGSGRTGAAEPLLYLATQGPYESCKLRAVSPDGTVRNEIGWVANNRMQNGVLLGSGGKTDVSPDTYYIFDGQLRSFPKLVWEAIFMNNDLYYAEVENPDSWYDSPVLLKKRDDSGDVLLASLPAGIGEEYYYRMSGYSDVFELYRIGEEWRKRYSLTDGEVVYPNLGDGEIVYDTCSGEHFFITGGWDAPKRVFSLSADGSTTLLTELPANNYEYLANGGWLYYAPTKYGTGSKNVGFVKLQ